MHVLFGLVILLAVVNLTHCYTLQCRNDADCSEVLGKKCVGPQAECRCLYWAICVRKMRCNPENEGNDCFGSECVLDLMFNGYYCKD